MWDAAEGTELRSFLLPDGFLAVSPDAQRIALYDGDSYAILVRDLKTGREVICVHQDEVSDRLAKFSPGGDKLAGVAGRYETPTVVVWDAGTGDQLKCFVGHSDRVTVLSFSPDGNHIATGSADHTVRVWSMDTGEEVCCFRGHEGTASSLGVPVEVWSIAWSPDSKHIASTAFCDDGVRVWRVEVQAGRLQMPEHRRAVTCLAFSPDGMRAASGSDDGHVYLWDVPSGKMLHRFFVGKTVFGVGFSSDGDEVVIDGCGVFIYDFESGLRLRRVEGMNRVCFPEMVATSSLRLQLKADRRETMMLDARTGVPVTWFADPLDECVGESSGQYWGGSPLSSGIALRLYGR